MLNRLMKRFVILIMCLTVISNVSLAQTDVEAWKAVTRRTEDEPVAEPQVRRVKAKAEGLSNFPTYLLTPDTHDQDPYFKDALVQPEAPGHSVCMSLAHYKEARDGYDERTIYKDMPIASSGFDVADVFIWVGSGFLLGMLSTMALRR